VVEKICNFKVLGLFCGFFLRLGTLLELFFKNQGSNCEIMDYRLILEKPRGFFAKLPGIIDFGIIFVRKKWWTQTTGRGPRPASVHDRPAMDGGTELTRAWPPATPLCKGAGQGAGEGEGSAGDPFQTSPKVGQWRGSRVTVVKAAVGRASVRGRLRLGIGARRSGGEAVGGGDVGVPFYRVGGGAGWPGDGGELAVVRHDGGGGGRFGRGSGGAVVGSDEGGGCSGHFESRGGSTRRWQWRHRPFGSGRKRTRRGPCVSARGWGGLAWPANGRGPVAGGGGIPMGGERGVGRPGWKERRAAAGLNPELGQNSKRNSF
jgi:hypothetical protein